MALPRVISRLRVPVAIGGAAFAAIAALGFPSSFAATVPIEKDGVWAQDYSDIKAEDDIRFGQLPNGMRYAIMHNTTPVGQVSIRLLVNTGSMGETDAQQGLAHFLEHMAFKGSKKVPEDQTIKILERLGLAFGADTNAFTSMDQTVYQFDLPKADRETVDTGLMLTRETVSELTLSQASMDKERGVILSEERLRDTPGYRANIAQMQFTFPGQRVPNRLPIGKVDVIKTAPVSEMVAYYRAHYRPEVTTLVVVGDIDANAIEAKVKELFTDWRNTNKAAPAVDYGTPGPRGLEAKVVVQPGASLEADLDWVHPYDNSADVAEMRRRDTVRAIALGILNRRLTQVAQGPNPPFQRAGASRNNIYHSADIAELAVTAKPEKWREAFIAAETLRRQAVEFGVRQDEVDEAITEGRTGRKQAVASASTRRSPQLASSLASAAHNNNVFTSPQQALDLYEEAVKGLTAAQVSAVLKEIFAGPQPLVFVATPQPIEGGEVAVLAALKQADTATVAAAAAEANKKWTYTSFGTPGREVERKQVADLGATFIRFANGVRLTVKPTTFTKDQISVNVRFGDGLRALPNDKLPPLWAASAFINGGLKDLNQDDIRRIFSDKVVSVGFGTGEDAFELRGGTRSEDLDSQMQLLAAYMTAPGFRPEAFERVRTAYDTRLDQVSATPGGVLGHNIMQLEHVGDVRWRQPDRPEIAKAKLDDLQDLLREPLANGDIEVVVVGDVTVDRAAASVAATFGALPARKSAAMAAKAAEVRFPGPKDAPPALKHTGRSDQAIAMLAWRTDDFYADTQRARATRLAEQILRIRLTEQFRIAEGNTYSPGTDFEASEVFPHYGFVAARVETPPAKIPRFFEEVSKIAADMRTKGVTDDELERARKPRVESLQRAQQTNAYWSSALGGASRDPRRLEAIRDTITGLQKVTAEDVKKAAEMYLTDDRAWKLAILPENPGAPS